MISVGSEFKLVDRGFKDTIILIPGWATDYRIFTPLNLNYNYILPIKFYPFKFNSELLEFLNKKSIDKISLFGWSLGGFSAVDFALKNLNRVDEVILLSIRKKFPEKALKEVECQLKKNKRAYLYKFYLECFSNNDKEGLKWFKKYLLRNYIREMNLKDLIYGLDYLCKKQINTKSLASIKKIRIFHGKEDRIAPIKEVDEINYSLACVEFVYLPRAGHICFLNKNFIEKFYNG